MLSQRFCLGPFLFFIVMAIGAFFTVDVSARDVETIPVWNPEILKDKKSVPVGADTARRTDSLETHGYKTMEISVGDGGTQVDQELRLSITGKLSDSVYVDALLSDVGRKAGDQTTATLREVDQIYFRVEAPFGFLHLGDLTWDDQSLGLYSIRRSSLGAMAGVRGDVLGVHAEVRGAAGTDEAQHVTRTFMAVSGQRSGYAMDPWGGYVSVVPRSETVWLNGKKLNRETDYTVNYAGGLIDFKGGFVLSAEDEIRIEYDSYEDGKVYTLYGAQAELKHPNVWLNLSGFRLENDVDRLKRGSWTDDDYDLLKSDRGDAFERDDSLGILNRPRRTDRAGVRIRTQLDHRFYADAEFAVNRMDTNMVSSQVNGPEGMAFRWYVTSDSSQSLSKFPLALSVGGNRIQRGFDVLEFQGNAIDWDSYTLKDRWDLSADDSGFYDDNLKFDQVGLRFRLWKDWMGLAEWGYRRSEDESWNSSRASLGLNHRNRYVQSGLSLVRVASVQEKEMERYQAIVNSEFLQGLFRPFGEVDFRYTEISQRDSLSEYDKKLENEIIYGKSIGGFGIYLDKGYVKESVGGRMAKRRGDSFDDSHWEDSLMASTWLQEVSYRSRSFSVSHLLQFEQVNENGEGSRNSWAGNLDAQWGNEESGLTGSANYRMGLTEEQVYTAIYKAVAPGTGDVRYDSLTGTYIEGVDNGDFVYEGLGRNDSVGAVLSSDVSLDVELRWSPGKSLGITRGILRDLTLGGNWSGEGSDTTGKKLYFPPVTKFGLDELTSGRISVGGLVEWVHPDGVSLTYKPEMSCDKKLSSISYYETVVDHNILGSYEFLMNHLVEVSFLFENEELSALQVFEWDVYDGTLKYRFDFLDGFFVQPMGRIRFGDGSDERKENFGGNLWETGIRLGYNRLNKINAFANFSVIHTSTHGMLVPYQLMSGFSDGVTYRLETSVSVDVNDFISMGGRYILRFGDAEENIFQKLSMEAKANF